MRTKQNKAGETAIAVLVLVVLYLIFVFLKYMYNLIINNIVVSSLIILLLIFLALLIFKKHGENEKMPGRKAFNKPYKKTVGYPVAYKPHKTTHPKFSKDLIAKLEWKSFERLCYLYIDKKYKNYTPKLTRKGADGGVDIEIYENTELFGVVQCKAWNVYKVGVKPIRELLGVMYAKKAKKAIFINSGVYTSEAEKFAQEQGATIRLVSGDELLAGIKSLPTETQSEILREITKGDYTTPTCPQHDIKMVLRKNRGKNYEFWGCRNYPKCRQTFKKT